MKKHVASLVLALALCLGLTAPVMADYSTEGNAPVGDGWNNWISVTNIQATTTHIDEDGVSQAVLNTVAPTTITVLEDTCYPDLGSSVVKQSGDDWTDIPLTTGSVSDGEVAKGSTYVLDAGTYFLFSPSAAGCVYIVVSATPVPGFDDVKPGDWYADPVQWAVENEITAGTSATTFSPNQTCTRGQIITFLWKAAGAPEPKASANGFSDVKDGDYFNKPTQWAKEQGMAAGDAFAPGEPCTRAMAVEFMWKLDGAPKLKPVDNFTDVSANDSYAQAVAWALDKGVTAGTSITTFSPDATCTRGQIVTMLYAAFGK